MELIECIREIPPYCGKVVKLPDGVAAVPIEAYKKAKFFVEHRKVMDSQVNINKLALELLALSQESKQKSAAEIDFKKYHIIYSLQLFGYIKRDDEHILRTLASCVKVQRIGLNYIIRFENPHEPKPPRAMRRPPILMLGAKIQATAQPDVRIGNVSMSTQSFRTQKT